MNLGDKITNMIYEDKQVMNILKENSDDIIMSISTNYFTTRLYDKIHMQKIVDVYKNNRIMLLKYLELDYEIFECFSYELRNDKEFVKQALDISVFVYKYISDELKKDKELALYLINLDKYMLEELNDEFRNDKDIVFECVKSHPSLLIDAGDKIRNDKDFILYVLSKLEYDYDLLSSIGMELSNDKEFFKMVISQGHKVKFYHLGNKIKKDIELATLILKNGCSISSADREIRNNRNLVTLALNNDGEEIRFVDNNLQKDKELCLMAIKNNIEAYRYIDKSLKKDDDILLCVLTSNEYIYSLFKDKTKEILLPFLKNNINEIINI